ncbi:hypothetical protein OHA79_17220 [Streptomyces sp. NBC_00841]|uniref:hypothetical protein n=1 Tax=Streptomyces sp. NBC_00841 TaxID=2975847 RepID=UPI002DD93276|nr:hypothetical protein [Streptomyces sp. NBC_00841]WRZ99428.1 hypothetical protein OHA79_17220 [Streptomyces sp. NBC_00841]
MAEVLLAGILGAVVLAAFLLHAAHRRNREIVTLLRAEVAAQRIAAITLGRTAVLPADDAAEQPEPARRKRRLALRISGGAPAFPASFGDRARSVWRGHPAATMTVTAASVAVAGALVLTSGGGTPQTANAAPPATAPGPVPGAGQDEKGDSQDAERSPAEEGNGTAVTHDDSDARPFSGPRSAASGEGQSVVSTEGEPSPGTSGTPTSGDEDQAEPTEGTPAPSNTAAPGPAGTTAPDPSTSPTTTPPPPTPNPTTEPTAPQKPDECDGLIDLHLPLLPDVCLP